MFNRLPHIARCSMHLTLIAVLAVLFSPSSMFGAIVVDPNSCGYTEVSPSDPATWTNTTDAYVGYDGSMGAMGMLLVDGGSGLFAQHATLGFQPGTMGIVFVEGAGSTWHGLDKLTVGEYGEGVLKIKDGANVQSYNGRIAGAAMGTVELDGVGSNWTNSGNLYVGDVGDGTLKLTNGATVEDGYNGVVGYRQGSTGTVTIDGIGSAWTSSANLIIGDAGQGTVSVTNGGTLRSDYDTILGKAYSDLGRLGASGTLQLQGPGSSWSSGRDIYVGKSGSALVTVQGGATVDCRDSYVGGVLSVPSQFPEVFGGQVTLEGPLSSWNVSNNLYVGSGVPGDGIAGNGVPRTGLIEVTQGATLRSSVGVIGNERDSYGKVVVDGPLSKWVNTDLMMIGCQGNGTLEITDGGLVSTKNLVFGDMGSLRLDGGTLELAGGDIYAPYLEDLYSQDNYYSPFHFLRGELKISDGSSITVDNSGLKLGSGRTITVTGEETCLEVLSSIHIGFGNNDPYLSEVDPATLVIAEGASLQSGEAHIGQWDATGHVMVDGIGSTWTSEYPLVIGDTGTGKLTISNGGSVRSMNGLIGSDSRGTVVVDGVGSKWDVLTTYVGNITVGGDANGKLTISNGARVDSCDGMIGCEQNPYGAGSCGTVIVDGVGSTWNSSSHLVVGSSSRGVLTISNGASVINTFGVIGELPGSDGSVVVDGVGSIWNSSYELFVGLVGNATLTVSNGGTVNTHHGSIGHEQGSCGTVLVDGVGSTWITVEDLRIGSGYNSSGTLLVMGGGDVKSGEAFIACNGSSGASDRAGHVTIDGVGSTWENQGDLTIGGGGSLTITNGGMLRSSGVRIAGVSGLPEFPVVSIDGAGSKCISQNIVVYGSRVMKITNGATVLIDALPGQGGSGIVDGSTVIVAGEDAKWLNYNPLNIGYESLLKITNGGLVGVESIMVDETSEIYLDDGTLALLGEVDGSLDDFMSLIDGAEFISCWDPYLEEWVALDEATDNVSYLLEYVEEGELAGFTLLNVEALELVSGDVNGDRQVDGSDVTILANHWQAGINDNQDVSRGMGDLNGDGKVDGSDVTILANNWQTNVNSGNAAVPEPSTVVLLLTAILCLVGFRRRIVR